MINIFRTLIRLLLPFLRKFNEKEEMDNKYNSRKYKLTLLILLIATVMCLLPPVVSVLILKLPSLVILSGTEWISVVTLVAGFYFGANVAEKKMTPP